ncbi:hypothetical protein PCC6311_0544 [Synechococcus elongatus PCC 6311]|uniref:Uncharacterized protein n=1 Tax=Synechococcus elongatus (strain ATCC 33912 / PCC 7942 / FACHB-805) TaxID=1140 RepID=Q31QW0_SYNE7|nr:hypothetical protein [Synechococcus elongatus]AJD56399.1 hypothetical protein M744_00320 [Synechococcus elongatus UTEX 2973]MBD2588859.1 hypothetical protein [Synechococcus elongatus FACHB-242]UOW70317.1 hypothetical protein PCC7943_0544 [Synechococcus elongatus PCC 7943]UOW73038.1 hypothetical protein PCC6311_0544 [Synechococcus elongatus PCC 6311]UOW75759.1 hypothetical protein PCC6301pg_0544 [Synechococcus elongatus PCC 6301]
MLSHPEGGSVNRAYAYLGLLLLVSSYFTAPAIARPVRGGGSRPSISRPVTRPAPSRPNVSRPVTTPNRPNITRPINTPNRPVNVPSRPITTPNRPINNPNRPINTPNRPIINQPINNRPIINRPIGSGNTIINNRPININNINTRPNWVNRNWAASRPWGGYGWYGSWANPPWGWWTANTAIWGITSLASAAIISSSIDNAVSTNVVYIPVPNSSYELYYGTIAPTSSSVTTFAFGYEGQTYQAVADCQQGLLNGQPPTTAAEAELLNAACQVAFASF